MKLFDNDSSCYYPSFYNIYINTTKSFSEIIGSSSESEFFHEYLHFLQDITTTFGLMNFSVVLNKVRDVYHCMKSFDMANINQIHLPVEYTMKEATSINLKLFKLYLQYTVTEKIKSTEIACAPEKEDIEIELPDKTKVVVPVWRIVTKNSEMFKFGAHAIMEGICHTLQIVIYNIKDTPPQAPYNLSKMIWDFMLPTQKDNIKAFIDLSEVSLMTLTPGSFFIEILKKIQSSEISINEFFYETIYNYYKIKFKDELNIFQFYSMCYCMLLNDIKGTFTANLYSSYYEWLIKELQIGYRKRLTKVPFFSEFLKWKDFPPQEITKALTAFVNKNGYPPVRNADGHIFCQQQKDESGYLSVLASIAMYSAYKCITNKEFDGCELKETCIFLNGSLSGENLIVDDTCQKQPWDKKGEQPICPFMWVWNTWGLAKYYFFTNT